MINILGKILGNAIALTVFIIPEGIISVFREGLRIFEKGFTGYNGRMDKKATGIGLYLCKRICDQLGIGITVDSTVGEGTVVCFVFTT